jgi:hypothetical protein
MGVVDSGSGARPQLLYSDMTCRKIYRPCPLSANKYSINMFRGLAANAS